MNKHGPHVDRSKEATMIEVTDLHGVNRYINAELVESVEANPDTQILLTNGERLYVKQTPRQVAERVIAYHQVCLSGRVERIRELLNGAE
jgi:flagellar protein FlbD